MLIFPKHLLLVSLLIASNAVLANTSTKKLEQSSKLTSCPIPQYARIIQQDLTTDANGVTITSETAKIIQDKLAEFSGNVTLYNEEQSIKAEQLSFDRSQNSIQASGNIHFQNSSIDVFASQLSANENLGITELDDSSYQLANTLGHGSAKQIAVDVNGNFILTDSSFTTCYGETPAWQIKANEINISLADNTGEAYHASLRVFDVPVIYIPYFTFPVTDQRKSGLLYPSISSSTNSGLSVAIPYYWNIAENMDATITPRYMSKRGTQLLTEFRYLSGLQAGNVNIEYLNKDDQQVDNTDPRYLFRWQHIGTFSDNYRVYVDYTKISDDNYLVDLDSEQYNANDAYLYQIGELSYFSDNWHITGRVQDFEILGNNLNSYKTVPQIEFNSQTPINFAHGIVDVYSELTHFQSKDDRRRNTNRYHIETGISFPYVKPAWYINSEFKLLHTYFQQNGLTPNSTLDRNVSRTLPKIRLHGGLNLERSMAFKGYTQTLEPQLQYLYIPDKKQTNIGLYDTNVLQDDYYGLFRDRRVSGLDRVIQANQISWGITSRVLSKENEEVMRLSLGKIVYFDDSNEAISEQQGLKVDSSAIAAEVFFQINRQWQFSADIQYNAEENLTNKSQMKIDYNFGEKSSLQLNHRYNDDVSSVNLEQMSLVANIEINREWQFVGRITQDLQQKRNLESYAGVQYESCCWAVRFGYHRYIKSTIKQQQIGIINNNQNEFNSGFMIQFVFKGLSGNQSALTTDDMLNNSIFGYKRPYFLNN